MVNKEFKIKLGDKVLYHDINTTNVAGMYLIGVFETPDSLYDVYYDNKKVKMSAISDLSKLVKILDDIVKFEKICE